MRRAARRRFAAVVAAGVSLGAGATLAVPAAGAPTAPSDGCGQPHAGGVTEETIQSAGTTRAYRLAVPDDYTGEKPLPLILNFHGFTSNAIQQAIYSQLEEKGPERGYVVVTPNGTPPAMFWNILNLDTPDDVAYTAELIDATEAALCINTARVYSAGMSNGAGMSVHLGCHLRAPFAAVASVAGVNLLQGSCPEGKDLPVIAFHGQADGVVPYDGGRTAVAALEVTSVEDAVAAWAKRDGCKKRPTTEAVSEHVQLTDYSGCDKQTDVQLYRVSDGSHTWPGGLNVPWLGHVTTEINAADLILDFFDEHRQR
jgi:polyhydroxybutyrate depolymerase